MHEQELHDPTRSTELPDAVRRCLLGILQRGLTEARTLLLENERERATDLLDALDGIPRHLAAWRAGSADSIRTNLRCFMERNPAYPSDYVRVFDERRDLL